MLGKICSTKQSQLINKSSDLLIKLFDAYIILVQVKARLQSLGAGAGAM